MVDTRAAETLPASFPEESSDRRAPELEPPAPEERPAGFLFARALRTAFVRVPVWGLCWLALWSMSLIVALPWFESLSDVMRERYGVDEQVHHLDAVFRADHGVLLGQLERRGASVGALLALFAALLIGVFAAGGWLQVLLHSSEGPTVRRFLRGGTRHFFRFLRVLLLVLLGLCLLRWTLYDMPWKELVLGKLLQVPRSDWGRLETLGSELTVLRLGWLQDGAFALGFAWIMVWAVYTRTRLALFDRSSAVWAGWSSFWGLLLHPFRTIGPLLAIFLVEAGVLAVAAVASRWLDHGLLEDPSTGRVALMHGIGQVALMARQVTRGASYHAAVEVCRGLEPPAKLPDPWRTIGGPGGPQYPVDDDDEFGVAL